MALYKAILPVMGPYSYGVDIKSAERLELGEYKMATLTVVDEETGVERPATPEELAAHIIAEANKTALVEISGVRRQELDKIVRYKHAKEIFSKGESFYEKMQEAWRSEVVEKFVESTFRQQEKTITKAESDAKLEYFQLLVARGTPKEQALEMSGL